MEINGQMMLPAPFRRKFQSMQWKTKRSQIKIMFICNVKQSSSPGYPKTHGKSAILGLENSKRALDSEDFSR